MRKAVLLGVLGLALAVGVGFAANAISRDSIGLASTPAGSGIQLSPAKTTGAAPARKPGTSAAGRKPAKPKPVSRPGAGSGTTTPTRTTSGAGASTTADDHGGRSRGGSGGSGSTPGGSGSGSGGFGSGSGGSGSSGGGSGGGHGGGDD